MLWKCVLMEAKRQEGACSTKTKTRGNVMRWKMLSPSISHARLSQLLFRDYSIFGNSLHRNKSLMPGVGGPQLERPQTRRVKDGAILTTSYLLSPVSKTLDKDLPKPSLYRGRRQPETVIHPSWHSGLAGSLLWSNSQKT